MSRRSVVSTIFTRVTCLVVCVLCLIVLWLACIFAFRRCRRSWSFSSTKQAKNAREEWLYSTTISFSSVDILRTDITVEIFLAWLKISTILAIDYDGRTNVLREGSARLAPCASSLISRTGSTCTSSTIASCSLRLHSTGRRSYGHFARLKSSRSWVHRRKRREQDDSRTTDKTRNDTIHRQNCPDVHDDDFKRSKGGKLCPQKRDYYVRYTYWRMDVNVEYNIII